MKKVLIVVVGIAAVGLAIWSGLWFVGRGQIEDRLDLEHARAEARGTTITWESREIGGFPFGYEMQATNVAITNRETGMLLRIPEVVSRSDASDVGRIETRLLGEILIDLPIPEERRVADPRLPRIAKLSLTGEQMLATIEGLSQSDGNITLSAREATLRMDQEDLPGKLDLIVTDFSTAYKQIGDKVTSGTQAATVLFKASGTDKDGLQSSADIGIDAFSLTASLDTPETRNLNDILFGSAAGTLEVVYSTGSIHSEAIASDATGQGGGTFSYSGGTATGIIGVQDGSVEIRGESRQNVWVIDPKQGGNALNGTITADAVQTHYIMPTRPTDVPESAKLRLAIIDLDADEELWTALDPNNALDRSKAELLLDVDATAKIMARLDQLRPTQGVPVQLSNVSLNTLNLKALGGDVHATGDVEVLQPINLPLGGLKIKLSNATAILLSLKQAGLIDEQMRATGAAMLQVYARPGEGEDTWETDLTFDNDGITMNGLRVQ